MPDLLATKLNIPPIRPALVPRPRLIEQLNRGLKGRLTLISAPAGFGKTTLLSEWSGQIEAPLAWLALDEADGAVERFLAYFVAALQRIDPSINLELPPFSADPSPGPLPLESILTDLVNDMAAVGTDYTLILDDYHTVESKAVHSGLTAAEAAPETAHSEIAQLTYSRLLLVKGEAGRALANLERLLQAAEEDGRFRSTVKILALLARCARPAPAPAI